MRILQLITRDNNRSGSGVQMMQLSIELARQGHDLTAIYKSNPLHDADFLPYSKSGVDLRRIDLNATVFGAKSFSDIMKIRAHIKQGGFDLVHSHSNAVDHAFLSTLGLDIPVIANRGMCTPLKWKNAIKYKSSRISHVIAVSEDVKNVMHRGGVPEEKISVIYGSVDTERFKSKSSSNIIRAQLGIEEKAFVIGYTGSIGGRKGIDYFIDAFRELVKIKPDVCLVMIGITDEELRKNKILLDPQLSARVRCLGFQHQPEIIMSIFDLFVFPGTKSEGLTGAVREAAAMAMPVVTTDVGGNRELIKDGERGFVVAPRSVSSLTRGITDAIDNYGQAKIMARRACAFVHANMTLQIRTQRVLSLYQKIIHMNEPHMGKSAKNKPVETC